MFFRWAKIIGIDNGFLHIRTDKRKALSPLGLEDQTKGIYWYGLNDTNVSKKNKIPIEAPLIILSYNQIVPNSGKNYEK